MKKIWYVLLMCMLMTFSLSACKDDKKEESQKETKLENIQYSNDDTDTDVQTVLETMLDKNSNADMIMYDLNMPQVIPGLSRLEYEVFENDAITADGKLTGNNTETEEVTIKVAIKRKDKYFRFVVPAGDDLTNAKIEQAAAGLIHNADNVRGNLTLVDKAGDDDEMTVTWKSSDTSIITDTATGENGSIPAGVVTRGDADQNVKLTATITYMDKTVDKEFDVTVKAKPEEKEYSAYVYTYFRGNIYGDGESQHIHAATSKDGYFWTALNDNEPLLTAELGTKGARDSFLLRSADGDHFYLIATDLDANGGDWAAYANKGSKCIRVWESDDLVNWSEERLIEIAPKGAGCMWAPEAFYDETTGEYVVYWATGIVSGNGKKIYYAKTRDFWTFTEPQIYKDVENGITFIDTSMTEYEGTYYRFTKNENELSILLETSDAVLGEYELVRTRIAGQFGVEGPAIYKINGEEKWCLYMDGYADANAGVGYFPLIAESLEDLKAGNFRRLSSDEYQMPEGAKHGSFVPITEEEYNALQEKWGTK